MLSIEQPSGEAGCASDSQLGSFIHFANHGLIGIILYILLFFFLKRTNVNWQKSQSFKTVLLSMSLFIFYQAFLESQQIKELTESK